MTLLSWLFISKAFAHDGDKIEYKTEYVKGGKLTVSCPAGRSEVCGHNKEYKDEEVRHDLWVGTTAVTRALYKEVAGDTSKYTLCYKDNCPVTGISWYEAIKLANLLSVRDNYEECYSLEGYKVFWKGITECDGYRLHTEIEWEHIRRGKDVFLNAREDIVDLVNHMGYIYGDLVNPVDETKKNYHGVHGMDDNIWEWVWDRYEGNEYEPHQDVRGQTQPDPYYVLRGGTWAYRGFSDRVIFRGSSEERFPDSGVRFVRTAMLDVIVATRGETDEEQ
jgi:formylglycine-generating enzyme required for sulfatase activity